jgi:hypothetical protein
MTTEEWRAKVAADRPPLTPEQIAVLRPICAQMIPHMKNAAPARKTEAAPHRNACTDRTPTTGAINAPR